MTTRWHPDTCEGFAEGKGCILDVEDWGVDGVAPTGTVIQTCAQHAELTEAHTDNLIVSAVRALMPPGAEISWTFEPGRMRISVPAASAEDLLAAQGVLGSKFPGRKVIL